MFDMSWGEVMVIGGVALIVIGPKDLPKALRTVGQMTTKVRRLASEFQSQFNEAMREAELDDVRREVDGLNRQVATATSSAFSPLQTIRDELKGAVEKRVDPPAPYMPSSPETALSDILPVPSDGEHHAIAEHSIAPPSAPVDEAGPVHRIMPISDQAETPSGPRLEPSTEIAGPGLEGAADLRVPAKSERA